MRALQFVTKCGLAALAAIPASADVFTFNFTSDHCSAQGGCSSNGTINPMGTVTLADFGGAGSGEVSVTVQLAAGFSFVSTGAGAGSSFFFNMSNPATIAITNINPAADWSIPNLIGTNQQASGSYAGDGLMGQYNHGLTCSGCGPGGSSPVPPPLVFDVTLSGLTAANFSAVPFFAADVLSSNGPTGLIDASPAKITTTPEPSSLMLFGSALIGVAAILRRRVRRKAYDPEIHQSFTRAGHTFRLSAHLFFSSHRADITLSIFRAN